MDHPDERILIGTLDNRRAPSLPTGRISSLNPSISLVSASRSKSKCFKAVPKRLRLGSGMDVSPLFVASEETLFEMTRLGGWGEEQVKYEGISD